jgi:8-oxo-dGTP diphosphatase/2-hydroxy-dATP diphosphatase
MTLTLVIVHQHNRLLLGRKKRGFGAGKWNGFGGKLEPGESLIEGAKRELWEEAGIEAVNMEELGRLVFRFQDHPEIMDVHVFKVRDFSGQPIETNEMTPGWFNEDEAPFEEMWPDDRFWFPLMLKNKQFKGLFSFDDRHQIVYKELYEL